jgi:DNA-binding NarL/FixJ family response regulator
MHRILIVDDDDGVRALLARHFNTLAGFTACASAASGSAAIEEATIQQPTGVVLDLSLPDVRGSALIAELRARCPSARIVIYSADAGASREATSAGADGFVVKGSPLSALDELFARGDNPICPSL